jgi:hypothetical protein
MTTKISEANIQPGTLATLGGGGPKISSIIVTDSSYNNLDDTAVALGGGYIKLIGEDFATGCQVLIGLTPVTSVTFVSATEVRAQVPATAAGTYIVYLVNPDGGTAIRVNAITFSGTPTWVTGSALAGTENIAISIQLSATGATTFALAAGSTLPSGVSLSSSGLLSGTVTGITQEIVYNFIINAIDAELQDSPRSFAFTVTSGDQFFNSTTLLLPGSATTFVRDASTNNFPVTVFGDIRPNNFNPYLTGWSNYFDGTGDYLTLPSNTAFNVFGSDMTIECWFYANSFANSPHIFAFVQDATNRESIYFASSALTFWSSNGSGNGARIATSALATNTWYHMALVKSGSTFTLYLNGTSVGTSTTTQYSTSNQSLQIGTYNSGSFAGDNFNGYISNVRIVKGTAVYTAAFTPPTSPLTAIANTSLLTCTDNRFIDDSTNNFAITRTGDVTVDSFSPFQEPATTNGSAYFPSAGATYIRAGSNTALALGAGDFTLECWVYLTSLAPSYTTIFDWRTNGDSLSGFPVVSDYNNNGTLSFVVGTGGGFTNVVTSSSTMPIGSWFHLALVRSGTTVTMYFNGVSVGSGTSSANIGIQTFNIGNPQSANYTAPMYVSNMRLVKGTAVYTTAFTPPTASLTAVANTSLLTLQNNQPTNNSMFLDSSTENFLITRNGNTTQGTFSPYSPSGWSNYFDGNGDYLTADSNAAFNFGTGDFTVEAWVYPISNGQNFPTFLSSVTGWSAGASGHRFNNVGYASKFWFGLNGSGGVASGDPFMASNNTFAFNTWHHYAITRSGNTFRMFVNGVLENTQTFSGSYNAGLGGLRSGWSTWDGSQGYFTGSVSNLRLIKGTAVYTANFTPPTQPLTAIAGTSLLTCADNRFVDDSPNNFTLTRTGDVRVQNFAPFRAVTQTPNTYSAFFDGAGDYLSVPDSDAFSLGSSNFTMECWIHPTATNANFPTIAAQYGGSFFWSLDTLSIVFYLYSPGATLLSVSNAVVLNTWSHHAVVRNANTLTYYINGTSVATIAFTGSVTDSTKLLTIGNSGEGAGYTSYPFTGYISNFRLVKGTAVYTANFTPSTQPLTAIANTSLLTCQNPTFVDNSTNRFAVTAVGNSQPSMVNPLGFTFASGGYSAVNHSGSIYFDGSGDFLTLPANNSFATGTGDFTIEGWIYVTDLSAIRCICGTRTTPDTTTGWNLAVLTNGSMQIYDNTGYAATGAGSVVVNTWCHFAFVRQSNVFYSYINGTQRASTANTRNWTQNTFWIGANGGSTEPFAGYMSDIRFVKGQARYTSSFAPPIAPVQPVQNTVLLVNGTSAAITDATTKNVLETVGDVRVSTAVSKFGGSSMNFDGAGDVLKSVPSITNVLSSGNFTIEFWLYPTNTSSAYRALVSSENYPGTAGGWSLYQNGTSIEFWITSVGSATINAISAIAAGTWQHLALSRSSGTLRLFVNGTSVGSVSNSTSFTGQQIWIGDNNSSGGGLYFYNGYMQDLRITTGAARYTANFTPPATPFQTR